MAGLVASGWSGARGGVRVSCDPMPVPVVLGLVSVVCVSRFLQACLSVSRVN